MNLKIAAIGLSVLVLTTCSSPAGATTTKEIKQSVSTDHSLNSIFEYKATATLMSKEYLRNEALLDNGVRVDSVVNKLKNTVGKTWYVFSGNTPAGWDCSGLTMWFYEQLNISLEHRASVQDDAGTKTKNPKPGDLVVFKYIGSKQAYHVGIYIGNGEMIHAPRKGEVTRIESVKQFGGNYSKISYRSLIDTL
jgi:cell wall-associated NlpC family hydrolase